MSDHEVRLRKCIKEGNFFIVSRLLKRFPDLLDNIDPSNGWSNLHYASFHNNYKIAELLLKLIYTRFSNKVKEKRTDNAVYTQITDEDEIKLNFDKQTVIHVACLGDSAETLHILLSYFNVCIDQRDKNGYTATHICCINGFSNTLLVLLQDGAYPNLQDNEGDTPLHKAFQFSHMDCIELLLRFNANDRLLNNVGWKPVDVAFSTDLIQQCKTMKEKTLNSNSSEPAPTLKLNQSKRKPLPVIKSPSTPTNTISFTSTYTANTSSRINLPPILPRKYSISSSIKSEEYVDKFDDDYQNSINSNSSKNSRNSSPAFPSSTSFTTIKKPPLNVTISESAKKLQQPTMIPEPIFPPTSRRATISNYSAHESPNSKRSSLSTRTFRSNSQLSDLSPTKPSDDGSVLTQQDSGSSSIVVSNTPRNTLLSGMRSNSLYPLTVQVEEASSKLQDFKLKNVDRLKLDTKLGNIINNTSQENLTSPLSSSSLYYHPGLNSESLTDNFNNDKPVSPVDTIKRSKILSIPISSSRTRHNSSEYSNI